MRKLSNEGYGAAFKTMLKTPSFMAAATAGGVGLAWRQGAAFVQRRRDTQAKTHAYKEMLDLHPHLKDRDAGEISRVYNSLHNVSPAMARDPMVAGAWVDSIVENKVPGMNSHQALLTAVKDLSGVQKNVLESQRMMRPDYAHVDRLEEGIRFIGKSMDDVQKENVYRTFKEKNEELSARVEAADAADLKTQQHLKSLAEQHLQDKAQLAQLAAEHGQRHDELVRRENAFNASFAHVQANRPGHAPAAQGFQPRQGLVPSRPKRAAADGDLRSMLRALKV